MWLCSGHLYSAASIEECWPSFAQCKDCTELLQAGRWDTGHRTSKLAKHWDANCNPAVYWLMVKDQTSWLFSWENKQKTTRIKALYFVPCAWDAELAYRKQGMKAHEGTQRGRACTILGPSSASDSGSFSPLELMCVCRDPLFRVTSYLGGQHVISQ